VIDVRKISKTFRVPHEVKALVEVSTKIDPAEVVVVCGPSGSGKSTFLRCLNRLEKADTGHIYIDGIDVLDRKTNINKLRAEVGMVFQSFNLFPHFSILENVCMPMRFSGTDRHEMKDRAAELLARVGLGDRLRHSPSQLSGGQCQRVAIARALASRPAVILADEPTGNLDVKTGDEILGVFHELVSDGHTVIMVTHNAEYEKEVQRVIELNDGNVVRQ